MAKSCWSVARDGAAVAPEGFLHWLLPLHSGVASGLPPLMCGPGSRLPCWRSPVCSSG
ncbi:MAG: hypothetical protein U1F68_15520 [Gammaproteobacteria bacterium]